MTKQPANSPVSALRTLARTEDRTQQEKNQIGAKQITFVILYLFSYSNLLSNKSLKKCQADSVYSMRFIFSLSVVVFICIKDPPC